MRVVVHDATVLIDLIEIDLLGPWFRLGFKAVTTTLVWREVNRKGQKGKLRRFADTGYLRVESVNADTLTEVVGLHMELSCSISLEDASVLHLAAASEGVLLTSDSVLRRCASEKGVEVHGILWVFDTLVSRGKLNPLVAAERLEALTARGISWLPKVECTQRIKKWRRA